ncbi:cytochrome P450 [Phellopilus nigrolimitatus]|nr:cytochrome P450 [Phellopilus nigrolimitatus]
MTSAISFLGVSIPGVVAVWLWTKYSRRHNNAQRLPLPPGPKGLPVIGNIFDMPKDHEWLTVAQWRKTYGDIIFVENLGMPIVFLNSYQAAVDLFEKRSSIYSSRPSSIMISELERWDWFTSNMPYGERWRKHRAALYRFLEPSTVVEYMNLQTHETHKLLASFLRNPKGFMQHVRNSVGATIMMMAYGHKVQDENDPYITLAEDGIDALVKAATPGAFLVEVIPWLKYVPAWFPGAGFQRIAKEGYELSQAMRFRPYYQTKEKILKGIAQPCMTSELIELYTDGKGNIPDEELIASVLGIVYGGGADTSVSSILTFILAMVLNPEVQRRAQEEIDNVIGFDRLPAFEDKENLPYVNAICKESLRWQPVTPIGGPRATTKDDIYNGYFIPEGTTVIVNQWLFLHDPDEYPEPSAFKPERFIPSDSNGHKIAMDPAKVAFGFGRRICPGRHLAMNSIFIAAASILATFDIKKAVDKDGKPVTPKGEYISSLISHPAPFECAITLRSRKSEILITQVLESEL